MAVLSRLKACDEVMNNFAGLGDEAPAVAPSAPTGAGTLDLAEQEREEMAIIKSFLPAQMDDEQVRSVCAETVKTTGAAGLRDMGKCMQALKQRYAGRMDFGKASTVVRGLLT